MHDVATPVIDYDTSLNETQKIKAGDSLELKVNTSGAPTPKTSWWHNNAEIKPDQHVTVDSSGLTVKNTSADKTGKYKVVARNRAGSVSAEFNVVVLGLFNSLLAQSLSALSSQQFSM